MGISRRVFCSAAFLAAILLLALIGALAPTTSVWAYDRWSIDDDATYCGFCHGDFRSGSYTGATDGLPWGNLHNIHRFDMVNGDCAVCHQVDFFPVNTNDSDGGNGDMPSIGCVGCHGRAEDATGGGTEGYGTAIQRRHEAAAVGPDNNGLTCFNCHADAATATPVGEEVLPPYYANPGTGHFIPTDPCNLDGNENFAGSPDGLDNNGDLIADNCTSAATPGEVSGQALPDMLVTSKSVISIGVGYTVPCSATNHRIHYGPLDQVDTYGYTGATCGIGASGSYTWNLPPLNSLFFIVVADDGTNEGSYGLDNQGGTQTERPHSSFNVSCPLPQDLANRCD